MLGELKNYCHFLVLLNYHSSSIFYFVPLCTTHRSSNRQIKKQKRRTLKVELNPGPPKHRITKQLLYLLCHGSFIERSKFCKKSMKLCKLICEYGPSFRRVTVFFYYSSKSYLYSCHSTITSPHICQISMHYFTR